jgi:hypothetical protein
MLKLVAGGAATAIGVDVGRRVSREVRERYGAIKTRRAAKDMDNLEDLKRRLQGERCPECRGLKRIQLKSSKATVECPLCGGDGEV